MADTPAKTSSSSVPSVEELRASLAELIEDLDFSRQLDESRAASRVIGVADRAREDLATTHRRLTALRWLSDSLAGMLGERRRREWLMYMGRHLGWGYEEATADTPVRYYVAVYDLVEPYREECVAKAYHDASPEGRYRAECEAIDAAVAKSEARAVALEGQ